MKKTITYKTKTKLIDELLKEENIIKIKKSSLVNKFLKKKEFADIYFFSGKLDKDAIANIENSKKTVVNSKAVKNEIIKELELEESKIEIIYPAIDIIKKDVLKIKEEVYNELQIEKDTKTVFFTAKNFKNSGVIDFLNVINFINYKNMVAIIAGKKKEINNLRFQLSRVDVKERVILLEDYKNTDDLFYATDIFFLPTYNKSFASNVLKAMYCKCAVFTTIINDASELIDVFSTMESPSDRSMLFKLDALLQNDEELNMIKEQNFEVAKEFTLEKQIEKIKKI